jgi:hypothetical protein
MNMTISRQLVAEDREERRMNRWGEEEEGSWSCRWWCCQGLQTPAGGVLLPGRI